VSKLPLVSLRVGGQDEMALAVPPDRLAVFTFGAADGAVELRYRFGFTDDARPELQRRAPFACVLYRTERRWHFRSALARYYELFPEPFAPFAREQGGWFFAAPTGDLANPQHFHYHEGGPASWKEDDERGLGTYPYQESSSYTVSLAGDVLPKSYEEAIERFDGLAAQVAPAGWAPQQSLALDEAVKHSGARSLLADSGESGAWTGGRQVIAFDKPWTKPIIVRGFSRAENVGGAPDHDYSIYVDVCYAGGGYLFGQCATFATGTHDWQQGERLIEPTEPVAELRVYCLLRNHSGKAWFDDLHIGPADDPAVSWVLNPGFEEDEKRRDLQFVRDNVCYDEQGRYVVFITDNLSADVGPSRPMNLLRFTLNVDPDLPDSQERPAVAARQFEYYDRVFRDSPSVDGCYIDSVSAWCSRVLNTRRDQWRANDVPFTYYPGSFKVAAHGIYAMQDFLGTLQKRYHPLGKAVFTNIHVSLEAFPLYLVSDVPGIESSQFRDQDSLFFYRACSYHKPLLLLNFMNLHGLDRRDVAEEYHLNAAQWGEFPSTGRFVQEAYRGYGDVTHAYLPAIEELGAAGWEPVPLASGARAERFGREGAVYFTVRGPEEPAQETLLIEDGALARLGDDLAAFDAVRLAELPMEKREGGWALPLAHGAGEVRLVRIGPREAVAAWLLGRARAHAVNASRVRGAASATPGLAAAVEELSKAAEAPGEQLARRLTACRRALDRARAGLTGPDDDLYLLSQRREVLQAEQALAALAVFTGGATLGIQGTTLGLPGQALELTAEAGAPEGTSVRLVRFETGQGRDIVPDLAPSPAGLDLPPPTLRIEATAPQALHARAVFEVDTGDAKPWLVERVVNVYILPAAELSLSAASTTEAARSYRVRIERKPGVGALRLRASVTPEAPVEPASVEVAADRAEASFAVERRRDGLPRVVEVVAEDAKGSELARAEASHWDEPDRPEADLALASRGAKCTTDSDYPGGYRAATIVDGVTAVEGIHWTDRAWASRDNAQPHWVQIELAEPREVGEVRIYWSVEEGRVYSSERYSLVGLTEAGQVTLAEVEAGGQRTLTRLEVGPVRLKGLRIEQPAGGGPAVRPGIMWIREVCLLP